MSFFIAVVVEMVPLLACGASERQPIPVQGFALLKPAGGP
jgi:hypothetical protein